MDNVTPKVLGGGAWPPPVGAIGHAEETSETSNASGSEAMRRLSSWEESPGYATKSEFLKEGCVMCG